MNCKFFEKEIVEKFSKKYVSKNKGLYYVYKFN